MPHTNYLPKDKHDMAAIQRLAKLSAHELSLLIPELLTWLQDGNWPVATPIAQLLLEDPQILLTHLTPVLLGDDEVWTYHVLNQLVAKMPLEIMNETTPLLERLASTYHSEDEEGVRELALHLLKKLESSKPLK